LPYTIARKGERIYIDSNVFVYCFYSKHKPNLYAKAKDFLSKVENGKFVGIVSSATIMEIIKSLRELLVKYGRVKSTQDVETLVQQCISPLFSIPPDRMKFLEGRPPDLIPMPEAKEMYYYNVSNEALRTMQKYPGKIGTDMDTGEPEHKGLHAVDTFHVVLAKKLQCDKLATFAWEFKETAAEITPLILIDNNAFW